MFYRTCKIYKLEATRTIVRILYVIVKNILVRLKSIGSSQ